MEGEDYTSASSLSEYTSSESEEEIVCVYDEFGNTINTDVNCKKKADSDSKRGPRGKINCLFNVVFKKGGCFNFDILCS